MGLQTVSEAIIQPHLKSNFYLCTLQPRLLQPLGRAKIVAIFRVVAISSSCYLLLVVTEALQKSSLLQFFRCNNRGWSVLNYKQIVLYF